MSPVQVITMAESLPTVFWHYSVGSNQFSLSNFGVKGIRVMKFHAIRFCFASLLHDIFRPLSIVLLKAFTSRLSIHSAFDSIEKFSEDPISILLSFPFVYT